MLFFSLVFSYRSVLDDKHSNTQNSKTETNNSGKIKYELKKSLLSESRNLQRQTDRQTDRQTGVAVCVWRHVVAWVCSKKPFRPLFTHSEHWHGAHINYWYNYIDFADLGCPGGRCGPLSPRAVPSLMSLPLSSPSVATRPALRDSRVTGKARPDV